MTRARGCVLSSPSCSGECRADSELFVARRLRRAALQLRNLVQTPLGELGDPVSVPRRVRAVREPEKYWLVGRVSVVEALAACLSFDVHSASTRVHRSKPPRLEARTCGQHLGASSRSATG